MKKPFAMMSQDEQMAMKRPSLNIQHEKERVMEKPSFRINWIVLLSSAFLGVIAIASLIVTSNMVIREYKSWVAAWDQIIFAKENPTVVKSMQAAYYREVENAQKDVMERVVGGYDGEETKK